VHAYQIPLIADDRRVGTTLLQRALDLLIVTKPLGSGALLAAWMRGELPSAAYGPLLCGLLTANDRAGAIFARHGVRACTDITGFGLAGHLREMLRSSKVAATLLSENVPIYPGFEEVVHSGIVSSLHEENTRYGRAIAGCAHPWLFDPQTSGGLIAGVSPVDAPSILSQLHDAGYSQAALVGHIHAGEPLIHVR
ncbi:MAG: AIR synthase-related protein, partial [Gemmataceae bacterium]